MLTLTISVDGQDIHTVDIAPAGNATRRKPAHWLEALDFKLTDRQIEIVRMVATGMEYKQIALRLRLSERTVRGHMDDVHERTGLENNTMLTSWAWLLGLISEDDIIQSWRDIAPHLVQLA